MLISAAPLFAVSSRCGDDPSDAGAMAIARQAARDACSCENAPSASYYRTCVKAIVLSQVEHGALRRACRNDVIRCLATSTCGRPDRVTCCSGTPNGKGRCRVTTVGSCLEHGGCPGLFADCCDACSNGTCNTSTTVAPTTTSTTTTTQPSLCGNGVIDPGEQCDGDSVCRPEDCFFQLQACCQYDDGAGTVCSADWPVIGQGVPFCRQSGGTYLTGAVPGSGFCSLPGAPVYLHAGACGGAPIPPTPLCDANASGCTTTVYDTSDGFGAAAVACLFENGTCLIGTCNGSGGCTPAH